MLTIGQLAERSGVATSAIRFYEARGLIDSGARPATSAATSRPPCAGSRSSGPPSGSASPWTRSARRCPRCPATAPPPRPTGPGSAPPGGDRLDEQIARIERLRDNLDGCIGCGCLSLQTCRLRNPDDEVADRGPGPVFLEPGDTGPHGPAGSPSRRLPGVRPPRAEPCVMVGRTVRCGGPNRAFWRARGGRRGDLRSRDAGSGPVDVPARLTATTHGSIRHNARFGAPQRTVGRTTTHGSAHHNARLADHNARFGAPQRTARRATTDGSAGRGRRGAIMAAMALHFVASRPDPALVPLPWATPLEEWDDEVRRPAPPRPVPPRRPDRPPAPAARRTPPRRPRRRSRSGSTACCATSPDGAARRRAAVRGHRPRDADGEELPARCSPSTCSSRCPTAACSPTASPPRTCRPWSTRWWCCWSGCTWPTSTGATCRSPTCCSGAAPAASRRTSSTPRPASCGRPCRRRCASTTSPSPARTSSPSCSTCRPAATCATTCDPHDIVDLLRERYDALWAELTGEEEFGDRRDVADRAAHRAAQRPRLRRRRARHRHRLRRRPDVRIQPKVVELGHHRRELQALTGMSRRGRPGPPAAQRHRGVHRTTSACRRGPHGGREPLADPDLRADHGDGPARAARQARAGRDLPRDPRAPVVPLRAGRPRGRHLRHRPRLHRAPCFPRSRGSSRPRRP